MRTGDLSSVISAVLNVRQNVFSAAVARCRLAEGREIADLDVRDNARLQWLRRKTMRFSRRPGTGNAKRKESDTSSSLESIGGIQRLSALRLSANRLYVGYLVFAVSPILSMRGSRCSSISASDRCAGRRYISTCSGRRQRSVVNGIVALLRPLGLSNPLRILPWAGIAQCAATRAIACATESLGEVLSWDLCQQLSLVSGAQDVDLSARDRVEELLHDAEDAREAPGRVDDVHLSEALRVVVLRDGGDSTQITVD